MKQIGNKQHLVYMLQNSHLIASLPFVDQELQNQIPKSKVAYLIRSQQQVMQKDHLQYIKDLQQPQLSYVDSEEYRKQLERVQLKMQQKEKLDGQNKKKDIVFPEIPKKFATHQHDKVVSDVKKGVLLYENAITKNINLQLYRKYGPLVLKELIEVLDKEKLNLQNAIQKQKSALLELNKNRKYDQTEAYQRQYDIGERVKIMLNKRRKVE